MPDNADTTITTRFPRDRHCWAIAAIFCHRGNDDTLVPPNFRTIQRDGCNSFSRRDDMRALCLCGAKKQVDIGAGARDGARRDMRSLTGRGGDFLADV